MSDLSQQDKLHIAVSHRLITKAMPRMIEKQMLITILSLLRRKNIIWNHKLLNPNKVHLEMNYNGTLCNQ